ncbi:HAD family hydrolase [Histidinibacterium aquaticum]|uniref:HAD family hydrolase n=1 Tax=Histidinibacterium aquaticum TaxID=2613962 RepID=A0A5J5GNL1_9RHOB|nr:HAD family hydrolase [Histidinibacterium aquaticum]KAA9009313.1 HAD family hydrolase [Histidinibacterium aquaticum]
MRTELVIFDCDGVLVDSEGLGAAVLTEELAKLGIQVTPQWVREVSFGRSIPGVIGAVEASTGKPLPPEFEDLYRARLLERYETELKVTPGLMGVLSRLNVPACVTSTASPARVARTLMLTGLQPFFRGKVFTTSEVKRGKPAPDLFLHAARRMGARPNRTLVVEDSGPGMAAGLAAGMRVALYAGGSHMQGEDVSAWREFPVFDSWADFPRELVAAGRSNTVH